jgi:hypothetical protein
MLRIERDAFTMAEGYPHGLTIDGIPLRDRVWLSLNPARRGCSDHWSVKDLIGELVDDGC